MDIDDGVCKKEVGNGCTAEEGGAENVCVGSERTVYTLDHDNIMRVALGFVDGSTSALRELGTPTAETPVARLEAAPFVQRICTSVASSGAE